MPIIRPLSEFQTRTDELIKSCQEHDQPIFLTENGYGSVVLMSQTVFDQMRLILDLHNKLDEAKQAAASGDEGITIVELRRRSRARRLAKARRK